MEYEKGGVRMKEILEEIKACDKGLAKAVILAAGHFDAMIEIAPDKTYTTAEVQQLLDAIFEVHMKDLSKKTRRSKQ